MTPLWVTSQSVVSLSLLTRMGWAWEAMFGVEVGYLWWNMTASAFLPFAL